MTLIFYHPPSDALLKFIHDLQSSHDCGHASMVISFDFNPAIHIINYKALLLEMENLVSEVIS